MLYLKTSTDGLQGWNDPQGIGSISQWNILTYCLAQKINAKFCADPFTNIGHAFYNHKEQENWDKSYTKFFNFDPLPDLEIVDYHETTIDNFKLYDDVVLNIVNKKLLVNEVFPKLDFYCRYNNLKNRLNYGGENYFDNDKFNISFHIRATNPGDIPPNNPFMETFPIWINENHIINLIEDLQHIYKEKNVNCYIHSQGLVENFSNIEKKSSMNFKIILKLNRPTIEDIYHMSNSDFFILSKSSYAWICHLMNDNQSCARVDFHQPLFDKTLRFDNNYKMVV